MVKGVQIVMVAHPITKSGDKEIVLGVLNNHNHLSLGSTQPGERTSKSETDFTFTGTAALPK
jgi:hypothetical protein